MKVYLIGIDPIYVDEQQGTLIKRAVANKADYISIDGELYKTSVITAITNETESNESMWGTTPPERRLAAPAHVRAELDSEKYKAYKERRKTLGI